VGAPGASELPMPMTAAQFYDELAAGAVCEISRSRGRMRMRIEGAYILRDRIVLGDGHGRSVRLAFTDPVVLIAR
jgi:hypothetical protein